MKRLLLLLLLLPSFVYGAAGDVASINGKAITAVASVAGKANAAILTIGGKPCADGDTCSTPTADVASEGFEGCAADGSSGCDETWATTGTGLTYNYSLPGTPPTGACSKGLQVNTDGADYTTYDNSTGLTTYWAKFTIYIASESFSAFQLGTVWVAGSAASGTGYGLFLQLYDNNGTFQIRANNGSTASTATNLSTGEWHTIEICSTDGGIGSDPCGAGTNGMGWYKVDGGAAVTHACADVATSSYRYFNAGMVSASRTADIIFGYIIIDDDGTY